MQYRPDIDGLRAIAVLAVIVYHIWPAILPGGFVGVDVFFVISGYLITLQIIRDLEAGRFTLSGFYRRRIKRIAPAMIAVVLATVVASELMLRPADAEEVSRSALWSLLSLANVFFWLREDSSYFAAANEELPLLHLWSLGVEEQFYIFWPLIFLVLVSRARHQTVNAVLVLSIIGSFLFGQFYYRVDPPFVYYMLPSRVAELMLGAVAARLVVRHEAQALTENQARLLAFAGILLVAASLLLVSSDRPFPGFQAIPPTLGATFLILAGHFGSTAPSRWLQARPMVIVGLLSYSAYLWHWPILAFLQYGGFDVSGLLGIAAFIATFVIASVSFQYVEKPFRKSTRSFSQVLVRQYIVPVGAVGLLAVTSLKLDGVALRWFDQDYRTRLLALRETAKPQYVYDYVCQKPRLEAADLQNDDCWIGENQDAGLKVLLFGDSIAAQYVGMLGAIAEEAGFSFYNVEVGACPPVKYGIETSAHSTRLQNCQASLPPVWAAAKDFDVVILGSYWPGYYDRVPEFSEHLGATLGYLLERDIRVVLLGMTPIIHGFDRYCEEKSLSFPLMDCSIASIPLDANVIRGNSRLRDLADSLPGVDYFDPNEYLCPNQTCAVLGEDGLSWYFDPYHISVPASWRLGSEIIRSEGVPPAFDFGSAAGTPSDVTRITVD